MITMARRRGVPNKRTVAALLFSISESPGATTRNLIRKTGITPRAVCLGLRYCRENGLLYVECGKQRRLHYFINLKGLSYLWKAATSVKNPNIKMESTEPVIGPADLQGALTALASSRSLMNGAVRAVLELTRYIEAHRQEFEEVASLLAKEGINLYDAPIDAALQILQHYWKHRESVHRLLQGGTSPMEALRWAEESEEIERLRLMRWLPITQWGSPRLRPAPPFALRQPSPEVEP